MASSSSSNIQKKSETTSSTAMEQLKHFSHEHLLSLVQLQSDHDNEKAHKEAEYEDEYDDDDEDEDEDDIGVPKDHYVGTCKMCEEEIYLFHQCYYSCMDCDYSLHKFCAELPETQHNHPSHPNHDLILSKRSYVVNGKWKCTICEFTRDKFYCYYCFICMFYMDIICATISEQKMNHPSHPHQLQRCVRRMASHCNACGEEHSGTFYQCTTCRFMIHLDCALLPAKLFIQQSTNENFSHSHLLSLAYSFPYIEYRAKFFPLCRVCEKAFAFQKWHYRCNKCRYYVHVDCGTSPRDAFMYTVLMPAGFGKTYKNFKDDDLPNLIHCPFPDENDNLLMHLFINKGELVSKRQIDGERFSHPHPLVLYDTLLIRSVSLHDPMKKVELICDGCVRPITNVPFYKCSQQHCDFFLHEWCTRLPTEIKNHHNHPEHTLVLIPKIPGKLSMFRCGICELLCNGFAYGCMQCKYYVDVNCGFIPDVITHEAHPNHFLSRFNTSSVTKYCKACKLWISGEGFHCPTCDFYLHSWCALLLPRMIRHKYDKHPLTLRYNLVENHSSEYFCDICEDEFDPRNWFYHCSMCASSMHTACAPLKLKCEQSAYSKNGKPIFSYINVKFGGTVQIKDHPHPLTFVQGINIDGLCVECEEQLQYNMIFKCSQCKFAIHYECMHDILS